MSNLESFDHPGPNRRQALRVIGTAAGTLLVPIRPPAANAEDQVRPNEGRFTVRPHLYLTGEKIDGLRSVEEVRQSTREGLGKRLWEEMIRRADVDLKEPPMPGGPRNFTICNRAGSRVVRHALACLITEDMRYRDAALAQIEAMFNPELWPNWRDAGHPQHYTCHLRHGMICGDLGLAYDWLHRFLSGNQRQMIVDGFQRYAFEPYAISVRQEQPQLEWMDNVMVCIRGGLAIAGMGLGDDYPDSQNLVDLATQRMREYLNVYGPDGSYNESVAYAGSTIDVVRYYAARHYWSVARGLAAPEENVLGRQPFPQFCRWLMHMTVPPGREACLGDGEPERRISLSYVPLIAAAASDGVLQWFYLNNQAPPEQSQEHRRYAYELLWYDPNVEPLAPEGRLPRGRAFRAHNKCFSSRTDWNPRSTSCVVYGLAGAGHSPHGHHDGGQVCIDGHGDRLIVDLGWGGSTYENYPRNVRGHNVLMIDGQDMIEDYKLKAEVLDANFDDELGGYWRCDTTILYEGVRRVVRTMIHLNPGIVVVLDEAELDQSREISLRWHTVTTTEPDTDGRFLVEGKSGTSLAARVMILQDGPVEFSHRQEEGHHRCEATFRAPACRILSVFSVLAPGETRAPWVWKPHRNQLGQPQRGVASIETADGSVDVEVRPNALTVRRRNDHTFGWHLRV